MTPLNPVQIVQHILELTNRISKGIRVYSERYADFLEKDREFDRAYAHAYLKAEGSIKDKEKKATLKTIEEREARDVADIAHRQSDKLLRALDSELRAWQSIGASVRQMYANAGRGEGA